MLEDFRNLIDNKVSTLSPTDKVFSFDEHIRQLKTEVKGVASDTDKYRVVFRAVQGMSSLRKVGDAKMILFHETVVTGLTTLYAVSAGLYRDFQQLFPSFRPTSVMCRPFDRHDPDAMAPRGV